VFSKRKTLRLKAYPNLYSLPLNRSQYRELKPSCGFWALHLKFNSYFAQGQIFPACSVQIPKKMRQSLTPNLHF
jgi:hypothetical protein